MTRSAGGASTDQAGIEAEDDRQHVVREAAGERAERLGPSGGFDRRLRFRVERVHPRPHAELEVGHGTVAVDEEDDLRASVAPPRRFEVQRDLANDVLEVPGVRELDPLGAYRGDVGPRAADRATA